MKFRHLQPRERQLARKAMRLFGVEPKLAIRQAKFQAYKELLRDYMEGIILQPKESPWKLLKEMGVLR